MKGPSTQIVPNTGICLGFRGFGVLGFRGFRGLGVRV